MYTYCILEYTLCKKEEEETMIKLIYKGNHIANLFHRDNKEEGIQVVCLEEGLEAEY